ncbi:MAG: hypothetical protein AB7G11_09985 [Phycisphaerales bacterium]
MTFQSLAALLITAGLCCVPACDKKPAPGNTAPANTRNDDHDHAPGDGHDHHDHAAVIDLGATTIGPFEVRASRDQGDLVAGKEAAINVTVSPAPGATATVAAVRSWIGAEDANGSVKTKADIEDPKNPNRWHTHAEIPSPLPAGSKLWVEIEDDKGAKSVGSFDLKIGS